MNYVYLFAHRHRNLMKIGTTENLMQRRALIASRLRCKPHDLEFIGALPGSVPEERATLAMFDDLRTEDGKEWFVKDDRIIEHFSGPNAIKTLPRTGRRTTLIVPVPLFVRAKTVAAQLRMSLRQLLLEGLQLRLAQLEKP